MANLPELMDKHSAAIPTQPHMLKMISHHHSDEQKERRDDWKKMQNIRVIARFRPSNKVEKAQNMKDIPPEIVRNIVTLAQDTDKHNSRTSMMSLSKRKKDKRTQYRSVLDHIFNTNTNQKSVFKIVGKPLIDAALNGFNATLFAYGQTGSGKTYSMFGANDDGSGNDMDAMGLIPRAFVYLFDRLEAHCNNQKIQDYAVTVQMLQIYNELLLDLLNPNSKTKLEIKTDFTNDSIFVKHLRKIDITSAREALAVLIEGSKNRIVASHRLNQHSSRSHMLVLLKIKQTRIDGSSTSSNINFGDLAGSENIAKAHGKRNNGKTDEEKAKDDARRREGISINKSLSTLTSCINSLVKGKHPGYRDSLLTHVLQDSLGGNSKTTLLVCASPHIYNRSETIRTLRFAATAKEVKNKAKINQTLSVSALKKRIKELVAENAQLKAELSIARGKIKNHTGRRSVVMDSLQNVTMDADTQQQPQLFAQYSSKPQRANATLTYQTRALLTADTVFNNVIRDRSGSLRDRSTSLNSQHGDQEDSIRNRSPSISIVDSIEEAGDMDALSTAVTIVENQMVIESEQYMQQIQNLNEQLQKEVMNSKELLEKTEKQNLEIDKIEGTVNHLRGENQEKAVKIYEKEKELKDLEQELNELKFALKDYKKTFPNHKPAKFIANNLSLIDDTSDIDQAGSDIDDSLLGIPDDAKNQKKDSMDIQVETLEKYLSTLGTTQTDLSQFTDKISANVNVLPEMRAEMTETYERTAEFYDDISKTTKNLQSQVSSMRFILENLAKNYDEDRDKLQLQMNSISDNRYRSTDDEDEESQSGTGSAIYNGQYGQSDDDDLYDGTNNNQRQRINNMRINNQRQRNDQIGIDIIQSKPSCWSSVFYCGGDNDKQIQHDIHHDMQNIQNMQNMQNNMQQQPYNNNNNNNNNNHGRNHRMGYDSYDNDGYHRKKKKKKKRKKKRIRNLTVTSYSST